MIDISPLLSDCPFRVLCNLVQGERANEQLSFFVQPTVSETPADEQRDNLGTRN